MQAGWKKDPVTRAYFEIKQAIKRRDSLIEKERAQQIEALDQLAAQILQQAELEATQEQRTSPRH